MDGCLWLFSYSEKHFAFRLRRRRYLRQAATPRPSQSQRGCVSMDVAPRYSLICSSSNSEASQIISWHVATKQMLLCLCKASATSAAGNSFSRSVPHSGQVTGNLMVGCLMLLAPRAAALWTEYRRAPPLQSHVRFYRHFLCMRNTVGERT